MAAVGVFKRVRNGKLFWFARWWVVFVVVPVLVCTGGCAKAVNEASKDAATSEVGPAPRPAPTAQPTVPGPPAAPPEFTDEWCADKGLSAVKGSILPEGPFAGVSMAEAIARDAAGRFPDCPADAMRFQETVDGSRSVESHDTAEDRAALAAAGFVAPPACWISLCPRGQGIPETADCYEWGLHAGQAIVALSDAAEAVTGETTWADIDREHAEEAWCNAEAVNLAKRHRLRSGLGIEKAIRRYVIETATARLARPDPLDMTRDLLLYQELFVADQNQIEVEWKPHYWAGECHVYATPRLEGEDVAARMWGAALDWTIVREGDGYNMKPADDDTKGVGR